MSTDLIPQLWARRLTEALDLERLRKQREELAWLRASLEADLLPDWLIEMVIENWRFSV